MKTTRRIRKRWIPSQSEKTTIRTSLWTSWVPWVSRRRPVKCVVQCEHPLRRVPTYDDTNFVELYSLTLSNTGKADNCKDCDDLVNKASRESAVASDSDLPPDSAKTRKIMELLDEIDERSKSQEKTIIFSQFTSMLSLIEPFLESRGTRFVRCKFAHISW